MSTPHSLPLRLCASTLILVTAFSSSAWTTSARAADSSSAMAASTSGTSAPANGIRASDAELINRFDKNGDGKLDENELADAKLQLRKESGDAKPEKSDAKALAPKGTGKGEKGTGGKRAAAIAEMRTFDKDGDGKLNDAEFAAFYEHAKNNRKLVARFDKNQDGKLDDSERAAMQAQINTMLAGAK